jgi:tetratricopeptide (TPR) repeat protein
VADELLDACPQDLSTLKIAQYHAFNAGNATLMLKQAERCRAANESRAQFHSMLAFAHEQCHQLDNAEHAANTALSIEPTEPWAQHALAHIHLGRGTTEQGLAFMLQHTEDWQGLNSFMFTHNWWHLALFSIAEGQTQKALEIFDERCWGVEPDYSQDQIGAVSLLARLECAGVDVGDRWQRLAPYLDSRAQDVVQPFLSLQYLYGLTRAQRPQADELLQLIHRQADEPIVEQDRLLWQQVGISAAVCVHAHALGHYSEAAKHLSLVRHRLVEVGGSHAQRDLFDQLLLDAYMQTRQWASARNMLEARCRYEPHNPVLQAKLNAVKQR